MRADIPVTVIIVTKNEERHLARCLAALERFDEIIVVDSPSTDRTQDIARSFNVRIVDFKWNGQYPKKRQWCLDNLTLKHDRVFFVDADEEVTPQLAEEISRLKWLHAGYFISGYYVVQERVVTHGVKNSKLCLFDRRLVQFPVVNDLDIPGMGEIEGHYQPVLKWDGSVGHLRCGLLHHAVEDELAWHRRHKNYAVWEKQMISRNAYPEDPVKFRQMLKLIFRRLPLKGLVSFFYFYIFRLGFLEGREGLKLCTLKMKYYHS